jgi:hypothetical protein
MADHSSAVGGDLELEPELVACTRKMPSLTWSFDL